MPDIDVLKMENEELLHKLKQREAELAVINSINHGLANQLDINQIYEQLGECIKEIFPTDSIIIGAINLKSLRSQSKYVWEKGNRYDNPDESRPVTPLELWILENKEGLIANEQNIDEFIERFKLSITPGTERPTAILYVPIITRNEVRGYVSLQNVEAGKPFDESDIQLLNTLTSSIGVALENARLLAETKQKAVELDTVNRLSQALVNQLDTNELIRLVGDQTQRIFTSTSAYVALVDKENNLLHFRYTRGFHAESAPFGEGVSSYVIKSGESILLTSATRDSFYASKGIQRKVFKGGEGDKAQSNAMLFVPIPLEGEFIGVLSVQSEEGQTYTEEDKELLETMAAHVGLAIHNARQFEAITKAHEKAEKADHAKSRFLSTVSHELRTPLTSVIGFAKIINKRLNERIFPNVNITDSKVKKAIDQVSENLSVVVSEGERLTKLINDVLDLAKIEAGKMEWKIEEVVIPVVVNQALASTKSLFDSDDVKLIVELPKELPVVNADRDKIMQVTINLLSNAAKFTINGSVYCSAYQENGEVIVMIEDTGMGISEEDLPLIFENFKQVGDTLTDKPKGTGLGLPICKEIIEHHNGRIWVESELGKGSKFYFSLPLPK